MEVRGAEDGGGGEGGGHNTVNAPHWLKRFLWQPETVILPAEVLQCVLQRERVGER